MKSEMNNNIGFQVSISLKDTDGTLVDKTVAPVIHEYLAAMAFNHGAKHAGFDRKNGENCPSVSYLFFPTQEQGINFIKQYAPIIPYQLSVTRAYSPTLILEDDGLDFSHWKPCLSEESGRTIH